MLKHIVMWKFKETAEGRTKAENIAMMHARLSALPPQISCILSFELGRDVCHTEKSYDMVLVSEFENVAKMLEYRRNPDHMSVSGLMAKLVESRAVVDFEF